MNNKTMRINKERIRVAVMKDNIIVMAVILLFFICMLFASINKFDNKGFFYALKWSIGTAFFVILLWTLVVTNVVAKIVFKKRDMVWFKPARVGND